MPHHPKLGGLEITKARPITVPCGTCRLCCKNNLVMLVPQFGDDPAQYQTFPMNGRLYVQVKDNGECIYLDEHGCSIHERAPYMCRIFDCRQQHAMYTRTERRELLSGGFLNKAVLDQGNRLRRDNGKPPKLIGGKS